MKIMKSFIIVIFCLSFNNVMAQTKSVSEIELITQTLMKYIEGTTIGSQEKLNQVFHPDFNLYTVADDTLRSRVW